MKQYMIGEKDGKQYVAHAKRPDTLDGAVAISKEEYRRHRAAGIPSWGETQATAAKEETISRKRAESYQKIIQKA